MKLIGNRLCRKRYKVQTRIRRWINGGFWGWDVGNAKAKKEQDKGGVSGK